MPEIIIDVAGETIGGAGVALEYTFDKIEGTPPLVTLTIDDNSSLTQWLWEILDQPEGASATLSGATTNTATFTPEAYIPGTYLIRCTFNGGASYARNAVAWSTKYLGIRIPAAGEELEYGASKGWDPAMRKMILAVDAGTGEARQRKVIDYVDNTAAPPSEDSGDRFILDDTGASHANWDGAPALSIVEFNGDVWEWQVPEEGMVAYVDDKDRDYYYVDDGAPAWEDRPPTSRFYDNTFDTGSITGTGGTWIQEVTTGLVADSGLFEAVLVIRTAGDSTNITIQIYDGDPSGSGALIYSASGIDPTALHDDRNPVWGELNVSGVFWLKITNDGPNPSTFDFRVRFKNDSE